MKNAERLCGNLLPTFKTICSERGLMMAPLIREKFPDKAYSGIYGALKNGNPTLKILCTIVDGIDITVEEFLTRAAGTALNQGDVNE